MLRHHDVIGLLRPASVDPASSYRCYEASQLAELNRIIAPKDLGFTLQQVQRILDEQVSPAELRGMRKLRRADIHAQIDAEMSRLAHVEARLLSIEEDRRVRPTVLSSSASLRSASVSSRARPRDGSGKPSRQSSGPCTRTCSAGWPVPT
jgi:DNA-binding transcriptional MerR regulator